MSIAARVLVATRVQHVGESCCAVAMTTMADAQSVQLLAELLAPQDENANEEQEVRELIHSTFYRKRFCGVI